MISHRELSYSEEKRLRELLAHSPRLYPGVAALVRLLQGRVRLAVVSGTWRENIQVVLESSGLTDAFDAIVARRTSRRRSVGWLGKS